MIARVLAAVGLAPPRPASPTWEKISSAEMRSGRYTIIADWNNEEIHVSVDGKPRITGFGSIEEAQHWCEEDRVK